MAQVVVLTDDRRRCVLEEQISPDQLEDPHLSLKIIERIAWGVNNAHDRDPLAPEDNGRRVASSMATRP